MSNVLVVGGAGFIGSHMVRALEAAHYQPVVLDNLSTGNYNAVSHAPLYVGDMQDRELLNYLFRKYPFVAVLHFASFISVAESTHNPDKYYLNNVAGTLTLLDELLKHGIKHFIFSSSAAVYGYPQYLPIDEGHPRLPLNPYGRTKLLVEDILAECARVEKFSYAALRYFNAAGADPSGILGESHQPETHLIPCILNAIVADDIMPIYGQHYPTQDGTCVRDFIHVVDLCQAHLTVLRALLMGQKNLIYNVGTGKGYSLLEVIAATQQITQRKLKIKYAIARPGDPAILIADNNKIAASLNFRHRYNLREIIQHAWQYKLNKNY